MYSIRAPDIASRQCLYCDTRCVRVGSRERVHRISKVQFPTHKDSPSIASACRLAPTNVYGNIGHGFERCDVRREEITHLLGY